MQVAAALGVASCCATAASLPDKEWGWSTYCSLARRRCELVSQALRKETAIIRHRCLR